jgi:glycosyltransferase involved in cell wall biosynthesis
VSAPRITVAVPSYNQGRYLDDCLRSIFAQDVPLEVFVCDGGSTDESVEVIERWAPKLSGWRSHRDGGQAESINEGVSRGSAPYVCWLNSDDWFEPGALAKLLAELEAHPDAPFAYGRAWNHIEATGARKPVVMVRDWSERAMANFCIVPQPSTLIRRDAWEAVGGVDGAMHMAMDYDLWWKLYRRFGPPRFIDEFLSTNREHGSTKTKTQRRAHYREAIAVVRKHYGRVPLKWYLAQPYTVWWWGLKARLSGR